MGLFKRNKVWWMRFNHQGKQVRRSTETCNKRRAERVFAKVISDIEEGKWFEKPIGTNKTLRDLLGKYLEEHSVRNKTPKSHVRDKSLAGHLNRYLGDYLLADIAPRDVSSYKSGRRGEGAAPNTVNNELRLLSHAFNLALKEWEWVDSNPVSMVSKEKVNNQVERWLTDEEEGKLMSASPVWLQEIITFAINTGLRQAEILDLTWDRVDLFRKTLTILEQKNKGKDCLPINALTLNVLKVRNRIRLINSDLVFFSKKGTRIDANNLQRAFNRARVKSGIVKCRFHDLRHTYATRMVQAGVDLFQVQKLMRHKSPIMTQRYAHHHSESLRDAVEVLDRRSTNIAQSDEIKKCRPSN